MCMIKEEYYGQSAQLNLGITKINCKNWQKLSISLTGGCFFIHLYLNLYFCLAQSFYRLWKNSIILMEKQAYKMHCQICQL